MYAKTSYTDYILQHRVVSHFLFWGSFLFIFTLLATLNSGSFIDHLINYVALLPVQMMAAYSLVYFLVPQFLLKKKYLTLGVSFVVSAYVFAVIARLVVIYIAEPFIRENFEQESVLEVISDPYYLFIAYFPAVYVVVFLMLALKTIKQRFEEKHQMQVLQKEKVSNELKFLKAQIHPHFLFNTLNNLYALTLRKSDVAPRVVLKLSEMLDYMLYQCNERRVAIENEITLIQGYIDLEMLRYGSQLEVVFNHVRGVQDQKIAPLILLAFVENAFKHGASGNPIDPKIHIDLEIENMELLFKVYNTKSEDPRQVSNSKGIGTANVNRQLELNYPNKHQLKVEETLKSYSITLKVDLK
ncbi:sensor histidine kinase [Spongiimicrobium salis]|uniref:sensor histidine kinase n=1 Tax=Spongiimicrobium salis TaxID=1667022 RepID=UPI00374CE80B